jgi:hypothetical protein
MRIVIWSLNRNTLKHFKKLKKGQWHRSPKFQHFSIFFSNLLMWRCLLTDFGLNILMQMWKKCVRRNVIYLVKRSWPGTDEFFRSNQVFHVFQSLERKLKYFLPWFLAVAWSKFCRFWLNSKKETKLPVNVCLWHCKKTSPRNETRMTMNKNYHGLLYYKV